MQLYLTIFAGSFLSAYSELKDLNHGRLNKLHFARARPAKTARKNRSLLADDTTTASPEASETTLAPAEDGAQLIWTTSGWSECSVDCGIGGRERIVNCFNNDTQTVQPESLCLADQFVIPSMKPDSSEECEGACITCTDHNDLFVSIGLSIPPVQPVPNRKTKVCKVADTKYSCCDKRVENTIVTQVISIQHGFDDIPTAAKDQVTATMGYISNSTSEFKERLTETSVQLAQVESILAQPTNLKMDKKIFRALSVVQQVLTQRILDLNQAVANSTVIAALVESQLAVLMTDTSMTSATLSTGNMSASTLGKPATLSACVDATVGMFASLSCAACNPSFVTDQVFQSNGSATNAVSVSTNMCAAVYKQCSPTIRNSRRFLRQALGVMRSLHSNLAKSAARLQPALLELWAALTFDWLPGSNRPLSSTASDSPTFVPDLTSLDCIRNTKAFVLPSGTQLNEFCDSFFANWNYQFTIQNILKDVKRGTTTFGVLNRCDKCLHTIAMKISQILADAKGGLDVTLALSPEALADAGCVGLSSTPAQTPIASVKESLMSGATNFFAIAENDLWTVGEMGQMNKKSKRAISMILSASRAPLTATASSNLGLQAPTPFIHQIVYSDSGFEPSALANVSWDIINNATHNPPPSIWDTRWSSEVGIIASDMNCTSHTSCNPESGDAPFWFCANQGVCNGTIPCDDNERALLKAHPRCVKGLCVDNLTAIDKKCPDIAICPTTKSGQFGHTYFSKFKNIAPQLPPSDELVATEGAEMASAISQALTYSAGVCDCAFAKKTDERGATSLVLGDACAYAQCVAYAQFNEAAPNCVAGLNSVCKSYLGSCPNLVCDSVGAQWNVPTCEAKTGLDDGFALASDVKSGRMVYGQVLLILLLSLVI